MNKRRFWFTDRAMISLSLLDYSLHVKKEDDGFRYKQTHFLVQVLLRFSIGRLHQADSMIILFEMLIQAIIPGEDGVLD